MEWRLAWRQIRGHRRFSVLFVLNLALGLSGFVALDAFKLGLENSLSARSRTVLGADLSVSARRLLRPEEQAHLDGVLPPGSRRVPVKGLYSMVASGGDSRLANLKAVDRGYPFYGTLQLGQGPATPERIAELSDRPIVWAFPELLLALGLEVGQELKIGDDTFTIADTIVSDPTNLWTGASLAPRLYMGLGQLEKTGLVQRGSTVWYRQLIALPQAADLEEIKDALLEGIPDPAVRVVTHRRASRQLGRLLDYLNDYLGLVALVAMFLSGVGGAFLFRSFLGARLREVAVLGTLGNPPWSTLRIYLIQLFVLGVGASVLALGLGWSLVPLVQGVVGQLLPLVPRGQYAWSTVAVALCVGVGASAFVCFPFLVSLLSLKPRVLLEGPERAVLPSTAASRLAFALPLLAFWGLAVWQAHSLRVGTWFTASFLGAGAVLFGMGWALLLLLRQVDSRFLVVRLALRAIARHPAATLSCFLAIGLGNLLVNLIPQIQGGLAQELQRPGDSRLPSLFVFDIQEDQLAPLRKLAQSLNHPLGQVSAMVRGRVTRVNGAPFVRAEEGNALTREREQQQRMRNRGLNLTYRDGFTDSESLFSGAPFSASSPLPQISVEHRYAERMGWALGDEVDFDVQGIEVRGKIQNLRRVRWTSFQPNFFVVFQPGILEEAPKTFLASVNALEGELKFAFQNQVVARFPNISVIDVSSLVARLLEIVEQMAWAMRFMAILSLAAGIGVLYSIANHQARRRLWDMNLLKLLGADRRDVQSMFLLEFASVGMAAAIVGALGSLGVSYALSVVVFDSLWKGNLVVPLTTVLATGLLCSLVTFLAGRSVFSSRPLAFLQRG